MRLGLLLGRVSTRGVLGRRPPTDWRHVESYPLRALGAETVAPSPVVLGVNWYEAFDRPHRIAGRWWIGRDGGLGRIRGGHAIAALPRRIRDTYGWWRFYDQGSEGACVGFALSRAASLFNRERYDGFWLYREAQRIDEWPGEAYSGTSVRAGCEILRTLGHRAVLRGNVRAVDPLDGIEAYRWATTVDEILAALGRPGEHAIPLLNSWGTAYPRKVWIPVEIVDRLLREDGEAAILTDR